MPEGVEQTSRKGPGQALDIASSSPGGLAAAPDEEQVASPQSPVVGGQGGPKHSKAGYEGSEASPAMIETEADGPEQEDARQVGTGPGRERTGPKKDTAAA